jgi:glycosyltransferase involved in cell wall biosynthesis
VAVIQGWIRDHKVECTFLPHPANLGICKSLNEALALARGKYIAMIAADDAWLPDRLRRQVRIMEQAPADVGVIYSDAVQMDEQGRLLPGMFIAAHRRFTAPPEGRLFDVLWEANFIPAMTALIRRECFLKVGGYDEELCFEDYDMWLRISRECRFAYDPIAAAKYRIVATSMVRTWSGPMGESLELIRAKCYMRGWLNPAQEKGLSGTLLNVFQRLYRNHSRIPWRLKMAVLQRHGSFKQVCLVLAATCGLPDARLRQFLAVGRSLKNKFIQRKPDPDVPMQS